MTRTVSARVSNNLHEELRDRCNKLGCTINEFVAAAIEFAMNGSVEFEFDPEEEEEHITKPISNVECCEANKPVVVGRVRVG